MAVTTREECEELEKGEKSGGHIEAVCAFEEDREISALWRCMCVGDKVEMRAAPYFVNSSGMSVMPVMALGNNSF